MPDGVHASGTELVVANPRSTYGLERRAGSWSLGFRSTNGFLDGLRSSSIYASVLMVLEHLELQQILVLMTLCDPPYFSKYVISLTLLIQLIIFDWSTWARWPCDAAVHLHLEDEWIQGYHARISEHNAWRCGHILVGSSEINTETCDNLSLHFGIKSMGMTHTCLHVPCSQCIRQWYSWPINGLKILYPLLIGGEKRQPYPNSSAIGVWLGHRFWRWNQLRPLGRLGAAPEGHSIGVAQCRRDRLEWKYGERKVDVNGKYDDGW